MWVNITITAKSQISNQSTLRKPFNNRKHNQIIAVLGTWQLVCLQPEQANVQMPNATVLGRTGSPNSCLFVKRLCDPVQSSCKIRHLAVLVLKWTNKISVWRINFDFKIRFICSFISSSSDKIKFFLMYGTYFLTSSSRFVTHLWCLVYIVYALFECKTFSRFNFWIYHVFVNSKPGLLCA